MAWVIEDASFAAISKIDHAEFCLLLGYKYGSADRLREARDRLAAVVSDLDAALGGVAPAEPAQEAAE